MGEHIREGTDVKWKWGDNWAHGTVEERFTDEVTRTIDGNEVTRDASEDDPAYLIKQDDGDRVLKSKGEVERDD
ncbi:MAG: DUF2945 domain-containing protein [Fuerstiella sp.]